VFTLIFERYRVIKLRKYSLGLQKDRMRQLNSNKLAFTLVSC
jgi:hypothetical protein